MAKPTAESVAEEDATEDGGERTGLPRDPRNEPSRPAGCL